MVLVLHDAEGCAEEANTSLRWSERGGEHLANPGPATADCAAALWTIAGRMAEANELQSKRNGSLMRIADKLADIRAQLLDANELQQKANQAKFIELSTDARLVAIAENNACAQIVEDQRKIAVANHESGVCFHDSVTCEVIANAIRERVTPGA